MEHLLTAGLLLLSAICILGIFAVKYDDRLLQRIGLSLTAAGCLLLVYARLYEFSSADETKLRILSLAGVLLFAISSAIKIWRKPLVCPNCLNDKPPFKGL